MPANPPEGMPTVCPYLYYRDVAAAVAWLCRAFGMRTRLVMPGPAGSVMHAELELGGGLVMMGPASEAQGTRSPSELPAVNQGLYVYVDDVDAHFAHARAVGAKVLSEPVDMFWGDRFYSVMDCEGHRWSFAQHVRDEVPEDMQPPGADAHA